MSIQKLKQKTLTASPSRRVEVFTQFGALCYRQKDDKLQFLLITTRGTGRWGVPKGWPMEQRTPARTAALEAFEEAGVEGQLNPQCIGIYTYAKNRGGDGLPFVVAMFPLRVKRMLRSFPERGQRKRKWVSRKKALQMIEEPELRQMIQAFSPRILDGRR